MDEPSYQPTDPSEEELRAILERREQVLAMQQHNLGRIVTRVVVALIALALIGFFSSSENREIVASLFREPAPEPVLPPAPPRLPTDVGLGPAPAKPAAGQVESASDELLRTATNASAGPLISPESISSDGKIISKEDIGFASELLNFAEGPRTQRAKQKDK
ncbi:hypothetical protein [Luteolibacter soli]|uniref:Uncharacterized protein n=1 Tax=Luteolibacter soli TaxID=3135280 RepID=A0ABU9ATY3_9BACT